MHRLEQQRDHTRSPSAGAMLQARRMPSNASNRSYGSQRQLQQQQQQQQQLGGGGGGGAEPGSSSGNSNAHHSHSQSQTYSQHSGGGYSTSYGGSTYYTGNGRQNSLNSNTSRNVYSTHSQHSHLTAPLSPSAASPPPHSTTFASARPPSALFAAPPTPTSPPAFRHNDDRLKPKPLKGAFPSPQTLQQGFPQTQAQQQDMALAVTICGDGGCGKSSLTLRVVRGAWTSEYDPTIEDSYSVTRRVDGQTFSLHITDTAGQEEYRELFTAGSSRALKADAFLLVYSIASAESLRLLDVWAAIVDKECDERQRKGGVWPGVMVVGNKCDLSAEREVSAAEGLEWARKRGYGFMETSARECVNIEETFSALVRRVLEARRLFANGHTQSPAAAPAVPLTTQGLQGPHQLERKPSNKWAPQQPKPMSDHQHNGRSSKNNLAPHGENVPVRRKSSRRNKDYGDEKDDIALAKSSKGRDSPAGVQHGPPNGEGVNAPRRQTKVPPKPVGYQDTGFASRLKVALSFQWCF